MDKGSVQTKRSKSKKHKKKTKKTSASKKSQPSKNIRTSKSFSNSHRDASSSSAEEFSGSNGDVGKLTFTDARGGSSTNTLFPGSADAVLHLRPLFRTPNSQISPSPGLIVLFPSWQPHWVTPHLGPRPRISIAFNAEITSKPPFTQVRVTDSMLAAAIPSTASTTLGMGDHKVHQHMKRHWAWHRPSRDFRLNAPLSSIPAAVLEAKTNEADRSTYANYRGNDHALQLRWPTPIWQNVLPEALRAQLPQVNLSYRFLSISLTHLLTM